MNQNFSSVLAQVSLILLMFFRCTIFYESESFIGVSKHRETNESTRPQAKCFYCFAVFAYSDKTRSMSFGNNFS